MQPNLLSGLLNNASTSMKVVQNNTKKKEELARKELGTLSNVAKTTTAVAKANTPQVTVGFGDKNNPQSLLDLHKTTTGFQPLEFDNLMGVKQTGIPNLDFTELGTKPIAPQEFKTELDQTRDNVKQDKSRIMDVIANNGVVTKDDMTTITKDMDSSKKEEFLSLLMGTNAKVEGIDYNTEQENLMNIGNTGISVNPIKQSGEKILELKDYLKNNPRGADPILKTLIEGVVSQFDPTGGIATKGLMQTDIVNEMLPQTDNAITQGALGFAGNTVRGVGQVIEGGAGLVDKGIAGVQSVVEGGPMSQYQTRQTGVGEDILDIGAGATQTLASIYAMPASLLIGTGIEALPEEGQKAVAETMTGLGGIIAQTPGLKQWMESLPKNRQDEFKSELAGATVGLLMGLKNKGNIIKDPKLFIKENLNPVQIAKNFNENVIGIPSKALDMAVNTVGKVKIPDVNIKTPEVITSLQKTFNPDIDTLIDKSIKPTVVGKTQNVGELDKYRTNTKKSMDSIIENKGDIQYRNEDGVYKQGGLPSTINEFAQAIEQTKKKIYERYNAETKTAGGQGAKVDVNPIVLELQKLDQELAGQIGTKATRTYIQKQIKEIGEIGEMTPEMAQKNKQFLNNKLQAYYRSPNPNEVGNVLVDALINNNLGKILDDTIINALDNSQYRDLKNQYGSLSAIEKDVVKRALVTARKNTKGLVDFTDIMFAGDIAQSLLTGNPISAVKGLAGFGLKELYKGLNDVDKNVKSLFSKYSKNVSSTMNDSSNGMIPNVSTTKRLALPENRSADYLYEGKTETPVDLGSNIDKFGNKITPKQGLSNLKDQGDMPKIPPKIPKELPAKQKIADTPLSNLKNPKKSVKSDTLVSKSDEMSKVNGKNSEFFGEIQSREEIANKLSNRKPDEYYNNLKKMSNEEILNEKNKLINMQKENNIKIKEYNKKGGGLLYDEMSIENKKLFDDDIYIQDKLNKIDELPSKPKNPLSNLGKTVSKSDSMSKDLQPLYDEAKKYKSADEFINSNKEETIKMYRADSKKRDLGDLKERAFLTPNKSFAESYMENKVMGMHKGNKYLLEFDIPKSQVKEYVKGSEYLYNPEGAKEYKSQLKQIWEQANKKSLPPLPKKGLPKLGKEIMEQDMGSIDNNLIQEAKKYKSADEFVDRNILYRGETGGGGNYYSTDKDFALEFTPSGLEEEIVKKGVLKSDIYKKDVLPFAGNEEEITKAINEAKKQGKKAILVSEGKNQPNSVFVFDKSSLKTESQLRKIREEANRKSPGLSNLRNK